jgi:hypothetical protein
MEHKEGAPITLEYAVDSEVGDLAAGRVLTRIVKALTWVHILICVAAVVMFIGYYSQSGTSLTWRATVSIAFIAAQFLLLARCLQSLKKTQSRDRIFYVTFLVIFLYHAAALAWSRSSQITVYEFVLVGSYFAETTVEHGYLLFAPLLRRQVSGVWLQRLTWTAIAVLALSMVPWLTNNALRYLDPGMRGLHEPVFNRPTWIEAGILVSIVALFLLRNEHNRVLLRLVAAWWALHVASTVYESHFWLRFGYQSDWLDVLPLLSDLLRYTAATVPFAMLTWFTFRFTDSQRKEMGRRVVLAETLTRATPQTHSDGSITG